MPRNEAGRYRHIEVQPVAGALGAEIRGVNVAAALDDAVIAEIRQAYLDHLVIFFRDQKLTPPEQLAFAKRFGEPMEYPQLKGLPECPLITPVVKLAHEQINFGGVWHSDTTYLAQPPMASMLYAVEIPPYGGDTIFANQYMAYETLSEGLRRTLDGLVGRQHLDQGGGVEDARGPAEGGRRRDEGADERASGRRARTRRRAGRRSTSITATPRASRAGRRRRAGRCSSISSSSRCGPSSPAASSGSPAPSPSGTTAASSTTRSTTTRASSASCTA